jgi:hypothetical protein
LIGESVGGLLPGNNTDLQMIEANVLMEIDETYGENGSFGISFDGNYTIYNPNETLELLIGAPFQTIFGNLNDDLNIKVEGITKEFEIIYFDYENDSENPWRNYFGPDIFYMGRYFALCNATFSGYSNTTIHYSFESATNVDRYDVIWIVYDVGTASAWNNVTTEYVEFRVYGQQPSYYSNSTNTTDYTLIINNIDNGKSYLWFWEKVIIQTWGVFIEYEYYTPFTYRTSGFWFALDYFLYFFSFLIL